MRMYYTHARYNRAFGVARSPALKSGTAMRTTVKSGTAFAVPVGPSTPPLAYIRKVALYSDVIHLFDWKSAVEHDGGV